MKTKNAQIAIRISQKTKDEFLKIAIEQKRTISSIIDELIKKYVEKNYKLLKN